VGIYPGVRVPPGILALHFDSHRGLGHADIQTTMIYVHHVTQLDAADRLSRLVAAAEDVPRLRSTLGHVRDMVAETEEAEEAETGTVAPLQRWARLDSNQGPTDYESAALTS
jgi:hypothetical protein